MIFGMKRLLNSVTSMNWSSEGIIKGIKDFSIDRLQKQTPGVHLYAKRSCIHLFNIYSNSKRDLLKLPFNIYQLNSIESWLTRRKFRNSSPSKEDTFFLLLYRIVPHIIAIVTKVKISFFKQASFNFFPCLLLVNVSKIKAKRTKLNRENPKYLDAFKNSICGWLCAVPKCILVGFFLKSSDQWRKGIVKETGRRSCFGLCSSYIQCSWISFETV